MAGVRLTTHKHTTSLSHLTSPIPHTQRQFFFHMHFYLSEGSGDGAYLFRKRLPPPHSPHWNKIQVRKRLFPTVEHLGFTAIT